MEQKTQFQVNLYFKNYVYDSVLNFKGDTGCPTKYANSFECRLPYTVLDIKGCLQFISFKKSFAQICFTLKIILL